MKKFILLSLAIIATLGIFSLKTVQDKVRHDLTVPGEKSEQPKIEKKITPGVAKETQSIFIPYWSLGNKELEVSGYDELIYFGITPTRTGIDKDDPGYKNLEKFIDSNQGDKPTFLTLRMLDSKENFSIIESKANRTKVIDQTFATASEYNFDGVVLDLEVSAIPFDSVIQNISIFVKEFYAKARSENKTLYITVYGDTYFRIRPFDMKVFASNSDKILIMAYDFHKARGNPGPNFPLVGQTKYGYDYEMLTDNFLEHVPSSKLAVIFGMFGYDWQVDDKDKTIGIGKSQSYLKLKQDFIDSCEYIACTWKRDTESGEIIATYTDESQNSHIVWFEDPTSVERKKEFLKTRGINSFSFWSYSYF